MHASPAASRLCMSSSSKRIGSSSLIVRPSRVLQAVAPIASNIIARIARIVLKSNGNCSSSTGNHYAYDDASVRYLLGRARVPTFVHPPFRRHSSKSLSPLNPRYFPALAPATPYFRVSARHLSPLYHAAAASPAAPPSPPRHQTRPRPRRPRRPGRRRRGRAPSPASISSISSSPSIPPILSPHPYL